MRLIGFFMLKMRFILRGPFFFEKNYAPLGFSQKTTTFAIV